MTKLSQIRNDFLTLANPAKAQILQKFFKTGPGQYGEGDLFLGITAPQIRQYSKKILHPSLDLCIELLHQKEHELRTLAVLLMSQIFNKQPEQQEQIVDTYWKHSHRINNWDLVDISTPHILGPYYYTRDRTILYEKVQSPLLWDRRMAILCTFYFIRQQDFQDILQLCEILLKDQEDLMHKACGWMLREMGKKGGMTELRQFLGQYHQTMPRTMLRYAIEKMDLSERQKWMGK